MLFTDYCISADSALQFMKTFVSVQSSLWFGARPEHSLSLRSQQFRTLMNTSVLVFQQHASEETVEFNSNTTHPKIGTIGVIWQHRSTTVTPRIENLRQLVLAGNTANGLQGFLEKHFF